MSGATDIRVNKKCIIGQVIRVTCNCTTPDLRARDPRTPFVSISALTRSPEPQPRPDRHDTLATDLRLTCDVLRPIGDQSTTWTRLPRVICVTQQKFLWNKNFKVTCDRFTVVPTCKDLRPKEDPAASLVTRKWNRQIPRPFSTVKNGRGACQFQWRVGPSYCEYSGVTNDLVSNIGGTYDLAE